MEEKKYNTGDILVTPTWPIPIFNHYAIVFYRNGVGYIAHNSIRKSKIIIMTLEDFLKTRKIWYVISTDGRLDDEYIYNKTQELNEAGKRYNFFGYNCESYVREVCGCNWGTDQRKEFLLYFGVLLILGVGIFQLLKRT